MQTLTEHAGAATGSISGAGELQSGRSPTGAKRQRPQEWTVDLLAYAAGVIDSDGSIAIALDKSAMRARRVKRGPIHRERATLRQIDPQAVDLFHHAFGGSRFVYMPRRTRAQPLHSWQIGDRRASTFLAAIVPYLHIKRRQAELCVELRRLKDQTRKTEPRGIVGESLPDTLRLAMGELHAEILRLNRVEGRAARCANAAVTDVVAGGEHGAVGPALWEGTRGPLPQGEAELPVELLAYAAGVIDSDGSIGIRRDTYAMRVLYTTDEPTFSERVTIRQMEPEAVDLLYARFGGCQSVIVAKGKRAKRQPLQSLQLVDRKAAFLLAAVLPYLRIKRRQAELCLELRRLKEESRKARFAYGRGHRGGGKRPEAITAAMEEVHATIKALNRPDGRASRHACTAQ